MLRNRSLQRLLIGILAACLLQSAPALAAQRCAATGGESEDRVSEWTSCSNDSGGSFAVKAAHADLEQIFEAITLAAAHVERAWLRVAFPETRSACRAEWLSAPSRDPPKTVRFCTFLI
jgi:hypothetical protein